jgi:hypothetical protein
VKDLSAKAKDLLDEQIGEWKLLRENVAALASVKVRTLDLGEFALKIQFNPARITSTAAKTDSKSIAERKCFLCDANRPPEQRGLPFGTSYRLLCNPFPIFKEHFTIVHSEHRPQRIQDSFIDMLGLAAAMPQHTIFYNGPKCGASAPDHLHFQAGERGFLTIEQEYERLKGEPLIRRGDVNIFVCSARRPFIALEPHSFDPDALVRAFTDVVRALEEVAPDPDEPMMNVLTWLDVKGFHVVIFPRLKHRPSFYFAEGDEKILLSPASVDLGGVCIVPLEHDFRKLDRAHLEQMLREVMLPPESLARLVERLASNLG